MTKVTPEEIVEFVRGHGNLELSTLAQKHGFTVRAIGDGLEYVPCSSEKPRPHQRQWLTRVCEEFSRTNPLHPGDYVDLTVHASYTLAVIEAYLKRK